MKSQPYYIMFLPNGNFAFSNIINDSFSTYSRNFKLAIINETVIAKVLKLEIRSNYKHSAINIQL